MQIGNKNCEKAALTVDVKKEGNIEALVKDLYEDAFGLNELESDKGNNNKRKREEKKSKNYAEEIAGKQNFTVTISRSDDDSQEDKVAGKGNPRGSSRERETDRKQRRNQSPPLSVVNQNYVFTRV